MGLESYYIFRIHCDIPDCGEKKTSGDLDALRQEGWQHIEIFNSEFQLCPAHHKNIVEFFFDTRESKD